MYTGIYAYNILFVCVNRRSILYTLLQRNLNVPVSILFTSIVKAASCRRHSGWGTRTTQRCHWLQEKLLMNEI